MKIKEAAEASGVSAKMIRHYEAIGLVHPARRENNYRDYSAADVQTLVFIRSARQLDIPLKQVRDMLRLWRAPSLDDAAERRRILDRLSQSEVAANFLRTRLAFVEARRV